MSTAKFTPGPWAASKHFDLVFGRQRELGMQPLGFVYGPSGPEDSEVGRRALADVQLIAAAPELLEALVAILETSTYDDYPNTPEHKALERGRAVVAKATGAAS